MKDREKAIQKTLYRFGYKIRGSKSIKSDQNSATGVIINSRTPRKNEDLDQLTEVISPASSIRKKHLIVGTSVPPYPAHTSLSINKSVDTVYDTIPNKQITRVSSLRQRINSASSIDDLKPFSHHPFRATVPHQFSKGSIHSIRGMPHTAMLGSGLLARASTRKASTHSAPVQSVTPASPPFALGDTTTGPKSPKVRSFHAPKGKFKMAHESFRVRMLRELEAPSEAVSTSHYSTQAHDDPAKVSQLIAKFYAY